MTEQEKGKPHLSVVRSTTDKIIDRIEEDMRWERARRILRSLVVG